MAMAVQRSWKSGFRTGTPIASSGLMIESALAFSDPSFSGGQVDKDFSAWKNAGMARLVRASAGTEPRTASPVPTFNSSFLEVFAEKIPSSQGQDVIASQAKISPVLEGNDPPSDKELSVLSEGSKTDQSSFLDLLDIVNPLQHLPLIGSFYRHITGDEIKPISAILGGALFGGPIGAVASTVNVAVKAQTGRDITGNALALAGFTVSPDYPVPRLGYSQITDNSLSSSHQTFVSPLHNQGVRSYEEVRQRNEVSATHQPSGAYYNLNA